MPEKGPFGDFIFQIINFQGICRICSFSGGNEVEQVVLFIAGNSTNCGSTRWTFLNSLFPTVEGTNFNKSTLILPTALVYSIYIDILYKQYTCILVCSIYIYTHKYTVHIYIYLFIHIYIYVNIKIHTKTFHHFVAHLSHLPILEVFFGATGAGGAVIGFSWIRSRRGRGAG